MKKKFKIFMGARCGGRKSAKTLIAVQEFLKANEKYSANVYTHRCYLEKKLRPLLLMNEVTRSTHKLNYLVKLIRYELRGQGEWALARTLE